MKTRLFVIAIMLALLTSATILADVKIRTQVTTNILGAGATDTRRTEYFSKDRNYSESMSTPLSGLMAKMNKGAQKVITVTRLDKGVLWSLNETEKGYIETPLDTIKARLQESGFKLVKSPLLGTSTEPTDYKWRVTITKITEPTKIGWADCKGVIARAIGVNKNNDADKVLISFEQWFAENAPGKGTYDEYQATVKKVLGSDKYAEQRQIAGMLDVLGDDFTPIFDTAKTLTGIPVKLAFKVEKSTLFGFTEADYDKGLADPNNQQLARVNNMIGGKPAKTENGMFESFSIFLEVSNIEETGLENTFYDIPAGYTLKQPNQKK